MGKTIRWIFAVTGGILSALPWWGMPGVILLVSFLPLLHLEDHFRQRGEHPLSLIPFAFAFFFLWNLLVCLWLARISFLGGMAVIFLNSAFMTVVVLLYAMVRRVAGGGPVILAVLWIGFEFLHYRGDLSWPWMSLGNGLAGNVSLIQWYEFTGVTGGSLWILLVNISLFSLLRNLAEPVRKRAVYILYAVSFFIIALPPLVSLLIFTPHKTTGDNNPVFMILQPRLDPYQDKFTDISNAQRLQQLLEMASGNIGEGPVYIVAPETAVDSIRITGERDRLSDEIFSFLEKYPGTAMILGATSFSSVSSGERSLTTRTDAHGNFYEVYNSALFYLPGTPLQVYHKHYLANGVEQIPFQRLLRITGNFPIDLGGVRGSLRKGSGADVFISPLPDSLIIGPLICFESAYGEYASKIAGMGAEILVIISNDGWFKNTGAYRQHLRLSGLRAIETRRSIVRAANTGISCHISPSGEIMDELGWWEQGVLKASVPRSSKVTFFMTYGDFIGRTGLFFSVLVLLNLIAVNFIRRRSGPGKQQE